MLGTLQSAEGITGKGGLTGVVVVERVVVGLTEGLLVVAEPVLGLGLALHHRSHRNVIRNSGNEIQMDRVLHLIFFLLCSSSGLYLADESRFPVSRLVGTQFQIFHHRLESISL